MLRRQPFASIIVHSRRQGLRQSGHVRPHGCCLCLCLCVDAWNTSIDCGYLPEPPCGRAVS
jgi:hypothetical protein